jgi:hypothetical protein
MVLRKCGSKGGVSLPTSCGPLDPTCHRFRLDYNCTSWPRAAFIKTVRAVKMAVEVMVVVVDGWGVKERGVSRIEECVSCSRHLPRCQRFGLLLQPILLWSGHHPRKT